MKCYDCLPNAVNAAAVCIRCGAGLCPDHVHESSTTVHELHGTGRATHTPQARRLTCTVCHAAER